VYRLQTRPTDPRFGERQHCGRDVAPGNLTRTGLPARSRPFTVIEAFLHPTNRLGMWCFPVADLSGGRAKQKGSPSPLQVSFMSRSPALTLSL
jgi:hypothetical protein